MKYVLLDTNIFVRLISQGQPGCEPEHFEELKKLLKPDSLCLLLPEVVELELAKHWASFEGDVAAETDKLKDSLDKAFKNEIWNEMGDVKKPLLKTLEAEQAAKLKRAKIAHGELATFFNSGGAIKRLPFTSDDWLRAKKRLIAGGMPKRQPEPEKKSKKQAELEQEQDACIVESLISFFNSEKDKDATLHFCSENQKDFALDVKGKLVLHPTIGDKLPKSQFYLNLDNLLQFVKGHKKITPPPKAELQKALEEEDRKTAEEELQRRAIHPGVNFFYQAEPLQYFRAEPLQKWSGGLTHETLPQWTGQVFEYPSTPGNKATPTPSGETSPGNKATTSSPSSTPEKHR